MAKTNKPTTGPAKQIGTPKEPFTLESEETLVDGKPFFGSHGWGEGLVDDEPDAFEDEDQHPDADDLAPEIGTPDRYCAYELSILTGIPQRRIRSGALTPAEVRTIQETQNL